MYNADPVKFIGLIGRLNFRFCNSLRSHRVLSSTPATENRHLNGHGDRTDQLKMTSDRRK